LLEVMVQRAVDDCAALFQIGLDVEDGHVVGLCGAAPRPVAGNGFGVRLS
jgi:hypothetical protein